MPGRKHKNYEAIETAMICKTCGAFFPDNDVTCPYCKWENEPLAEQRRNQELSEYRNKLDAYIEVPEKAARDAFPFFWKVVAGVFAFVIVMIVIMLFSSRCDAKEELRSHQKLLVELEELYVAGDFGTMNDLLISSGSYGDVSIRKYDIIGRMYRQIQFMESSIASDVDFAKRNPDAQDLFDTEFSWLFTILSDCETLKENGYVYGEEAAATDFSQRADALLRDILLLTDEEITRGMELSKEDNPDYTELRNITVARLTGGDA